MALISRRHRPGKRDTRSTLARTAAVSVASATLATLLTAPAVTAQPADDSGLERVTEFEESTAWDKNPGDLIMVKNKAKKPKAIVVVLHGCGFYVPPGPGSVPLAAKLQYEKLGLKGYADDKNVGVLLPVSKNGCFTVTNKDLVGNKLLANEMKSIMTMIGKARKMYAVGSDVKTYVFGFSGGAGMAATVLAEYPTEFEAGAVIAGGPAQCADHYIPDVHKCVNVSGFYNFDAEKAEKKFGKDWSTVRQDWPRLQIWHGDKDPVVPETGGKNLEKQWANLMGLSTTVDEQEMDYGRIAKAVHKNADGAVVLERLSVHGMGHNIPIDRNKRCGAEEQGVTYPSVCAMAHALAFFGLIDDNEVPQPIPPCETQNNFTHAASNRADWDFKQNAFTAKGSGDVMGQPGEQTGLAETKPGHFELADCSKLAAEGPR